MSSQPKTTSRSVGKELSDKKRSNLKVFEREAKENSMKTVKKRKERGVENRNHSENYRGSCSAFRGALGFS